MCSPTLAVMGVMAVVGAASSYATIDSNNKNAKAQAEATADAANKSAQADYNAMAEKQGQMQEAGNDKKLERTRNAMRERATLRATSADMGLNGALQRFEQSQDLNTDLALGAIDHNTENGIAQTNRENEKTFAMNAGRINTAYSYKPTSGLGAGLQIASSTLNSGMAGYGAMK
jgi:hypothetical protein